MRSVLGNVQKCEFVQISKLNSEGRSGDAIATIQCFVRSTDITVETLQSIEAACT